MQGESHVLVPAPGETFIGEDGTVSVVLADSVDSNYEPTQEEIEEFSEWMGMKLPEDNAFLHIAREGLKAPLPSDWRPCRTNEDEIYYFNFRTGESTWNHPMDEFFRQKFLEEKEKACDTARRCGSNSVAAAASPSSFTLSTVSHPSTGIAQVPVLKSMPPDTIGSSSASFAPVLRSAKGVAASTSAGGTLPHKTAILHTAPVGSSLAASLRGSTVSGSSSGERRIISEAEKNLEDKIRQEREAEFKLEEEKAELMLGESLKKLRSTHESELKKIQEELREKQEVIRDSAVAAEGESLKRERLDLEEKWRTRLEQVLQEEKDLQMQLSQLREEHDRRVASAVAKAEAAEKEQLERQMKQMKAETVVSMERLRGEMRAEFMKQKEAHHKKAQEELLHLREETEKQHKADLTALHQKHAEEMRLGGGCATNAEVDKRSANDEAEQVAAIQAKQREELAAILRQSREDQAALRASMEGTLDQLRKELSEIEAPAVVSLGKVCCSTAPAHEEVDEALRRWQKEEAECLTALEEERRKSLTEVEQLQKTSFLSSVPPLTTTTTTAANSAPPTPVASMATAATDLRAENSALLAARTKSVQQIESLLRDMLQKELAHADAPEELQLATAVEDAFNVFVRSTEVRRRFEEEDFNRRRDQMLAEHASAKAVYDQKVAARRAEVDMEAREDVQEMLREKQQVAVAAVIRAVEAEYEVAMGSLSRRYEDERRALFAEVNREMLTHEQMERQNIERNEVLRAESRETELRLAAKRAMEGAAPAATTTATTLAKQQQPQSTGVPVEVLQQRLSSIERSYADQERKLQAELELVRAEMGMLGEALSLQEHRLPPAPQRQQQQPRGLGGESLLDLTASATAPQLIADGEKTPLPSVSSEALRFLSEQRWAFDMRRGALQAARDEWQSDVRNATSTPLCTSQGGKRCDVVKGDGGSSVNSQVITLIGALGDRLDRLAKHMTTLRTKVGGDSFPHGWKLEDSRQSQHHRSHRHHSHSGLQHVRDGGAVGKKKNKKSALHEKRLRGSHARGQSSLLLMQKWSRILLDLAVPSSHHNELSASVRRYMTD